MSSAHVHSAMEYFCILGGAVLALLNTKPQTEENSSRPINLSLIQTLTIWTLTLTAENSVMTHRRDMIPGL